MIGASHAEGKTVISNAAREPEIVDLEMFLKKMGANIKGVGSSEIVIHGVKELLGCEYTIIPDRIETGTFIAIAVITKSRFTISPIILPHLESTLKAFSETGVQFSVEDNSLKVDGTGDLNPIKLQTGFFPELATDTQPILTSVLTLAKGRSEIPETVYSSRFTHVSELKKIGADVKVEGRKIIINGVERLKGTNVNANDLRAGGELVVARLAADGVTEISNAYQIERGYKGLVGKLKNTGQRLKV